MVAEEIDILARRFAREQTDDQVNNRIEVCLEILAESTLPARISLALDIYARLILLEERGDIKPVAEKYRAMFQAIAEVE